MATPHKEPLVPFDYTRPCRRPALCRLAIPLLRFFSFFYFSRCWMRGLENIPAKGPVILALNHPAVADMALVGSYVCRRRLAYFIAEEELFLDRFPYRLLAPLIRLAGAFPVDRRLPLDRRAIGYAVDRLVEGELLVLAPEGGTERGWGLLPFHSGFALMALLAREKRIRQEKSGEIPIVPAAILYQEAPRATRTKKAMRFRAQAWLQIGQSFFLERFLSPGKQERQIVEEVTSYAHARMEELLQALRSESCDRRMERKA